ncbi:hypothetical protein [Elizabethkingia anophelis]|uniref:hypothetical protein n=1 Tax=Elizabethkingia anophelis TaxID=1117645 RepID=UPI0024E1FE21|nr:hypothetical protein [Elizabethkingia anophelis]CAI9679236.1 hypothetical protein EAVVTKC53_00930 [Elizabethkingia anophelis]
MKSNLLKGQCKSICNSIFLLVFFLILSCRSNDIADKDSLNGNASVVPEFLFSSSEDGNIEPTASIGKSVLSVKPEEIQKQTVKDDLGNLYDITLAPSRSSYTKNAQASLNTTAALGTPTALDNGVVYRVLVYTKSTGAFKTSKDYTVGSPATPITGLDGNVTYTFIVYSFNKPPNILGQAQQLNYSNVRLTGLSNNSSNTGNADLMYFIKDLTLEPNSTTTLTGTMLHQFARLRLHIDTSDINAITNTPGNITEIGNIAVSPVANSVPTFIFSTGIPTYGTVSPTSTYTYFNVLPRILFTTTTDFPGNSTFDSKPITLLTPTTTDGKIVISRVVTDGGMEFMGNITINNARITEKTDYDLTIKPRLNNIVATGDYGPFYRFSPQNSTTNTFSNAIPTNGSLASYSGIMLDGRIDGSGSDSFVPLIKNISSSPIAYNLKCGSRWGYASTGNNKTITGTINPGTRLENLDPTNGVYITAGTNAVGNRNANLCDQETCVGTITPQGGSPIDVTFRWRSTGSGYLVNDNYVRTTIQLN